MEYVFKFYIVRKAENTDKYFFLPYLIQEIDGKQSNNLV